MGHTAEKPVQLEGEGRALTVGPECAEAVVTVVPVKTEKQDGIPYSKEQVCTKGGPSRTAALREEDTVLNGVKSTEVTAPEALLLSKGKTSALPSETVGSEAAADAEQSVSDGSDRDMAAKDSVPVLEPQCRDKTTETPSKTDETKGGKVKGAVLKSETQLESTSIVAEAPTQMEADGASNLASACPEIVENGSAFIADTSPKKCETPSSLAGEETVGKGQELAESLNCQGFQKEDKKNEQLLDGAKEVFENGRQEAVRRDECSTAVQQGEDSDSAFPQAESLGALKTPVAVAGGEHVMAEGATHTDTTAKTAQPLATTPEQMASEELPVSNIDCSGCGTAELVSVEAAKARVTCASMNGVSEEQERPQSTGQAEHNGIPSSHSLSPSHSELQKHVVQSVIIESQSTKIVLNAIQSAVHKLAETEESAALESEQSIKSIGKSPSDKIVPKLLGSVQVDQQLPVKEEETQSKEQELQQPGIVKTATLTESVEIHATVGKAKDMPLTSELLKDGQSQKSLTVVTSPEDVLRGTKQSASGDATKDTLDIRTPKLREKEVGYLMEISDQHTGQQTCREGGEQPYHPPVEDGKTQIWEDDSCQEGTSCDRQSQSSMALTP